MSEGYMTATADSSAQDGSAETGEAAAGTGRVARVTGPVVDVEFPSDQMPEIYFALHVDVTLGLPEDAAKERAHAGRDRPAAVFCHKDQMIIEAIDDTSSSTKRGFHRN